MVNIEVRQNGTFSIGYPYNSDVDNYFKGLSDSFISNYGLDATTINAINDHKNMTLSFDLDLHDFLIKLSAFMIGFQTSGQVIINEYESLVIDKIELNNKLNILTETTNASIKEFDFIKSNIEQLSADLAKVDELILYYQSQVMDSTYVYNDTYISDTELRLETINSVIETNNNEIVYYNELIDIKSTEYVTAKIAVDVYDYAQITIRDFYESWQQRTELYYVKLVEYYKSEYEATWTYGKSILFNDNLIAEESASKSYKLVADLLQEKLFKQYDFNIEKILKEYSLEWLNLRDTFEEYAFILAVETKRKEILLQLISEVEQLIIDKNQAVRSIISIDKENNYYKYRELIQEKRKYVFMNIMNDTIDQNMLYEYDRQLNLLEADYIYTRQKFNQKTYWVYYADYERHTELLTDLRRQLDKTLLAIDREFKVDISSNTELYEKIDFYTSEKVELETKVLELTNIKDKIELEYNVFKDETTLVTSKIFELNQLMTEKEYEYELFFNDRISFFTQDVTDSENEGIIELLNGNFYRDFDNRLDTIKNYSSVVKWYDETQRTTLIDLYQKLIDIVAVNLEKEWKLEFDHEILSNKKFTVYEYYIEKKLRTFYAIFNKHILDGVYDENYLSNQQILVDEIKSIFSIYVDIAFVINKDITIMMNGFDYEDLFVFDISNGNETIESVKETFNNTIDLFLTYGYNKNIEFKIDENDISVRKKIDQVWLDMEKKYV